MILTVFVLSSPLFSVPHLRQDHGCDCKGNQSITYLIGWKEALEKVPLSRWQGRIMTPNFPNSYPPNCQCRWIFHATTNLNVLIKFYDVDFEWYYKGKGKVDHSYDGITLQKGQNKRKKYIYTDYVTRIFLQTNDDIYVSFYSDSRVEYSGFQMFYLVLDMESTSSICVEGNLTGMGLIILRDRESCPMIRLQAPVGHIIKLVFRLHSDDTDGEIAIYDGYYMNATLLFRVNSYYRPLNEFSIASSDNFLSVYVTGNLSKLIGNFKTFNKSVMSIQFKMGHMLEKSGEIQSIPPYLPSMYSGRLLTFSWLIKVEYGRWITFNWIFSNITTSHIFLRLFDGLSSEYLSIVCQISNNTDYNIQDRILGGEQCDQSEIRPLQLSGNVSSQFNALTIQLTTSDSNFINFIGSYSSYIFSENDEICKQFGMVPSIRYGKTVIIGGSADSPFYCLFKVNIEKMNKCTLKILHFSYVGWNTKSCAHAGILVSKKNSLTSFCKNGDENEEINCNTDDYLHLYIFCGKQCFGFSIMAMIDFGNTSCVSRSQYTSYFFEYNHFYCPFAYKTLISLPTLIFLEEKISLALKGYCNTYFKVQFYTLWSSRIIKHSFKLKSKEYRDITRRRMEKDCYQENGVCNTKIDTLQDTTFEIEINNSGQFLTFVYIEWRHVKVSEYASCSAPKVKSLHNMQFGNDSYSVHVLNSQSSTWKEAKEECEKMNSTLMTLRSKAEADAFRSMSESSSGFNPYPSSGKPFLYFLGLVNDDKPNVSIITT